MFARVCVFLCDCAVQWWMTSISMSLLLSLDFCECRPRRGVASTWRQSSLCSVSLLMTSLFDSTLIFFWDQTLFCRVLTNLFCRLYVELIFLSLGDAILHVCVCVCVSDPGRDVCFGGVFSRFLLDELLGYEDVILYSLKQLADDKPDKGSSYRMFV